MTFSNLYFSCKFEPLSDKQKKSLEESCIDTQLRDKSCSRESLNTCGQSIEQLLSQYRIYDPQKGIYSSWGGIEFPWEVSETTPNLMWAETDDKWKIAKYQAIIAYAEGDRVLLIEEDGHKLTLYEASEDILTISGAFDPSKWVEICHVETSIPAGIPSIDFLLSRFESYGVLNRHYTQWGKYSASWSENLRDQSIASAPEGLSIAELAAWIEQESSDRWSDAHVLRDFLYRKGDIVLVLGECEDALCLYVANQDIPVTDEILEEYKTFKPGIYWDRMYCVNTGKNRCLGPRRTKTPEDAYELVQLGSQGDYAEVPIPFYLKPKRPTLDEIVSRSNTIMPTQCEIDRLAGDVLPPEPEPPPSLPIVNVEAGVEFSGSETAFIAFTFSRTTTETSSALDVFYEISGNAEPSEYVSDDIISAPGSETLKVVTISAGDQTAIVELLAQGWYAKTITFTIIPQNDYEIGSPDSATIGINYD